MPRNIIIDTDPGQDDAVALLLALASPEDVTVLGITAVAGNVPLPPHFIVGMTNSAPSLVPLGQREVTVLVLV